MQAHSVRGIIFRYCYVIFIIALLPLYSIKTICLYYVCMYVPICKHTYSQSMAQRSIMIYDSRWDYQLILIRSVNITSTLDHKLDLCLSIVILILKWQSSLIKLTIVKGKHSALAALHNSLASPASDFGVFINSHFLYRRRHWNWRKGFKT